MATALEELTYDLSLRTLSQQEALLNEVRARTGILLAATAIAVSLLGGRALDDGERTALNLSGVGLGVLSFLLSVYVLAPKGQFSFSEGNQAVIDRMLAPVRWACLALVASVLLWSIGLALE